MRTINLGRRASLLAAALLLTPLSSACGSIGPIDSGGSRPVIDPCRDGSPPPGVDLLALEASGRYTVIAVLETGPEERPRDTAPVDVVSTGGDLIATTSPSEHDDRTQLDLLTAVQFRVEPAPVFEVSDRARLRIGNDAAPYLLILVRHGVNGTTASGHVVVPSVERDSQHHDCGEHPRRIDLESTYSDTAHRQIFLVSERASDALIAEVAAEAVTDAASRSAP